jgi:pilus assembly protein CpaB
LLAVALTCGLVAMMGVQQVLSSNSNDGKNNSVKVLVAKTEILPGQPLDDKNAEFRDWPKDTIPEHAVVSKEQFQERALKVRAFPGDIITELKLDKKGVRNASSDVPPGMRVASVPIDPTMTGTGLVRPGDRVDVLVTYKAQGRDVEIGKQVKTVLEAIEVFAIDGQRDSTLMPTSKDQASKNVSLLLTHEQAKLLKLAGDVGQLHLTLRGTKDDQRLDAQELFDPRIAEKEIARQKHGDSEQPATASATTATAEPPAIRKWKMEIFYGTERRVEEVDWPEEESAASTKASQETETKEPQAWLGQLKRLIGS